MPAKNALASLNSRQKIIGGVVVIVMLILVWQIYGLFGHGGGSEVSIATSSAPVAPMATAPAHKTPQQTTEAPKPKTETMTPLEVELMRLQQETQAKYLAALNQLQMLKLERDIAENNKAIMSARLDTVKTQKDIINLLVPTAPTPDYAQALGGSQLAGAPAPAAVPKPLPIVQQDVKYTVISVVQLKSRWSAVLGYQGNLYNVYIGDILPADGSKIISISTTGVVLEKDGERKIISLTPII